MSDRKKISTILSNGTKVEYDIILTFKNPNNNKDYVIYTDNTLDSNNRLRFYAAIYDTNLPSLYLGEPTTKEEWEVITNIVNSVIPPKN